MAIGGMQQIGQHQAEGAAVEGRNRAKLKNFDRENKQYLDDIMFDQIQYENEQIEADIQFDENYQSLVDSWNETDSQLNSLYREADFNVQEAVIDMYESDYAGTQTGRTAMRLAADNQRKLGQYKSRVLHDLMLAKEDAATSKDSAYRQASKNQRDIYNQVRFAPSVGPTPQAPELEAKPSSMNLMLGLAGVGLQGVKDYKSFKAKKIGSGNKPKTGTKRQPQTKSEAKAEWINRRGRSLNATTTTHPSKKYNHRGRRR